MSARGDQLNWPFAALWASATLVQWLISCSVHPWSSRWLVLLGILACALQAVSLAFRLPRWQSLPIPRHWTSVYWPEATRPIDGQLTWLLAWTSQLYVAASGVQLTNSILVAIPSLITALAIEIFLWPYAPHAWQSALSQLWQGSSMTLVSPLVEDLQLDDAQLDDAQLDQDQAEDEIEATVRSQSQGVHPNGEIFQTGWAVVRLAPHQKTSSLTIVFSPPFVVPPESELDCESLDEEGAEGDETIDLAVEHSTPAGMRIAIKRSQAHSAAKLKVMWHAEVGETQAVRRLP